MINRETFGFLVSYEHLVDAGIALGIFFLFLLFRKLFTKYLFKFVMRIVNKTRIYFLINLLRSFQNPMEWMFSVIGIYFAARYYPYFNHEQIWFLRLIRVSVIILVTWGLYHLSSASSSLFRKINETTNVKIDEILIPLLSKTIQIVIVAISISVILQEFGYNIEAFIAGLGLGGLAISLAARDALANILGGIVLISEKPFNIGDWVLTPSVEGTVEEISFRSTKIRTFAHALVTVPNATLSNENITNWSKMGKRQITFSLPIVYDTPKEKIQHAIERINDLLRNHEDIHQETIMVNMDQFRENGFNILLYFFTKTTVWAEYLNVREEINFKILDILEEEAIEIAVPTRKLRVETEDEGNEIKMRDKGN